MSRIEKWEHYLHPGLVDGIDELTKHIPVKRRAHHAVVRGLGVPHAEAAVVLDGDADEFHPCALGCLDPLVGVQLDRVEHLRTEVRIGPVGCLVGRETEVNKHSEPQVNKLLLELVEAFSCAAIIIGTASRANRVEMYFS